MKFVWLIGKAILVSLLILAVVFTTLECIDRLVFTPQSIFSKGIKQFVEDKYKVEVLFCGGSDMSHDVNPSRLHFEAFNFGHTLENYIETYYILKHYINEMPSLRLVVLEVNLAHFSSKYSTVPKKEYFINGYLNFDDMRELYKFKGNAVVWGKLLSYCSIIKRSYMYNFINRLSDLMSGKGIVKKNIHKGFVYLRDEKSRIFNDEITEQMSIRRGDYDFDGYNAFDEDSLVYFEKVLRLCKERNITVVTTTLPVTGYYLRQSSNYINKDIFFAKIINNPRFNKYIYKHLDFLETFSNRYELFLDVTHLNYKGSAVFSDLISNSISEILLKIKSNI